MDSDALSRCFLEQRDEIEALKSMCSDNEFGWDESKSSGFLKVSYRLDDPLEVKCYLKPRNDGKARGGAKQEVLFGRNEKVTHLPPITLHFELPALYPLQKGPVFTLTSCWLNFSQVKCHGVFEVFTKYKFILQGFYYTNKIIGVYAQGG